MKKLLLSAFITVLATVSVFAQQIKGGGFTPSTIAPGETAKYTIILEGLRGSIDQSAIPMPQGLKIVGTSSGHRMSIINGKTSSQTELIYFVHASDEGQFTVPEWHVEYNKKKYAIAPAKLIVDKNATPQQSQQNPFFDDDDDAFGFPSIFQRMRNMQNVRMQNIQHAQDQRKRELGKLSDHISLKLELPKKKIYVGEAIPCKLVFSFSKELANEGFKIARIFPQVNKSDAFDCTIFEDKYKTKIDDNGNNTISYDLLVTPLKAGSYNLDFNANGIFVQEFSANPFSITFGMPNQIPFETSTDDKNITVSDLPEKDKPASFNGAVGKFSLSSMKVEPESISVGEPCIVSVDVMGMGNFTRVKAPSFEKHPDWKTYGAKSSFADESNGMQYVGIKNFRYTIVPKKPDLTKTPKIEFSFFDPEKEQYQTLSLDGANISVAPTGVVQTKVESKQTNEKSPEPNFDKIINTQNVSGDTSLFKSPLFWIIQILILLAVAIFIVAKTNKLKLENDPIYAKKIRSQKNALHFLKLAKKATENNDTALFLENARKTIQNALAASSQTESDAILLRQAIEIMLEKGFQQEDIDTISTFFAGVDAINYGGLDKSSINIKELMQNLKKIHTQLK